MRFKVEFSVDVDTMEYVAQTGAQPEFLNNSISSLLERYLIREVFPTLKKGAMEEVGYSVNQTTEIALRKASSSG